MGEHFETMKDETDALMDENAALRARAEKAEAQVAAMRAALEALVAAYSVRLSAKGHANWHPDGDQRVHHSAWIAAFAALSSDAGRDLLRVVEAAQGLVWAGIDNSRVGEPRCMWCGQAIEVCDSIGVESLCRMAIARAALAAWEKRNG